MPPSKRVVSYTWHLHMRACVHGLQFSASMATSSFSWAITQSKHMVGLQGATATVSLRQPRTEAHLSQLAVLENFAEHGLYVKFSNQEAEELEREALALALEESTQEVGTDRSVVFSQLLLVHLA